jgi:hypothetical protein
MVKFETTVVRFQPNAMHDRFPGGGFASYDASELRVESPPERRGETLLIYHRPSPPESSPWRQAGRKLRFGIREEDLRNLQVLFDGAVEDLQDAS